jgi:glutathione synthase/RimK-type ligase-like ATP-grasp enzyme
MNAMRKEPFKVAILNEHESWQSDLYAKLRRAGIDIYKIPIEKYSFDISRNEFSDIDLVINRASPSAGARDHQAAVLFTRELIDHFERLGIPVINGSRAYMLEISKARQYQLLRRLGLPFPRTIVVNSSERAVQAAANLGPPLLLKPNIGGSGADIKLCDKREPGLKAAETVLNASADGIALVQEYKKPDNQTTYRVQMIGTEHVYSLKAIGRSLNRCPRQRDCKPPERAGKPDCNPPEMEFEAHHEDPEVLDQVRRVVTEGGLDTCGVEYLISEGARYYFDINALSNIVDDPKTMFKKHKNFEDPTERFVEFIKRRLAEGERLQARNSKHSRGAIPRSRYTT